MKHRLLVLLLLVYGLAGARFCISAHDIEVSCDGGGRCTARFGHDIFRCAVGRNGITRDKHEGDGATPAGRFPLREVFFRGDRVPRSTLKTLLPVSELSPRDGWCDQSGHPAYNRKVNRNTLEPGVSHEELYRPDHVYDVILVVGYNDDPVVPDKGSAIFVHVAREGFPGTAGCIAFAKEDLLKILSLVAKDTRLVVKPWRPEHKPHHHPLQPSVRPRRH